MKKEMALKNYETCPLYHAVGNYLGDCGLNEAYKVVEKNVCRNPENCDRLIKLGIGVIRE